MIESIDILISKILAHKIISSFIWVIIIVVLHRFVAKQLMRHTNDSEIPIKRWLSGLKNSVAGLLVVGLFLIWLPELQNFALSIAAFGVAIVIATKELILCLIGSIYQTTTRPFVVGDWVQVNGVTGEVADHNWVTTSLLEIDLENGSYDYSGKSISLPNSMLLSSSIKNLNIMKRYVRHSFSIIREPDINPFEVKQAIIVSIKEHCHSFHDVAVRYSKHIEKKLDITLAGPEPSVRVTTTNLGKNLFTVSFFCPIEKAVYIEQMITEEFMKYWHLKKDASDQNTI